MVQWGLGHRTVAFTAFQAREKGTHTNHDWRESLNEQQSYGASQLAHVATVHQQGFLATLTDHPIHGGSQGICMLGQLHLLMGLRYHVAVQDVRDALHESLNQALISASHQLPDHSSCTLVKMHMAFVCLSRLQGIKLQGWPWCRFFMVVMVLVLWCRWAVVSHCG